MASRLKVFEIDKPGTQSWKKQRLIELGFGIPEYLKFVPVDFESGESWKLKLIASRFDIKKPAVIVSTGVTMYLTLDAVQAMLREIATFAPGSTLAMTYLLPMEMADPEERIGREMAEKGARASGTPFISHFTPEEIVDLSLAAGFKKAINVQASTLGERYFSGRNDGVRPSKSEEILIATT